MFRPFAWGFKQLPIAPTMLGVVTLAVVCKRMQQLPIMLGPVVHCGKDTTHKTFETFVLLDGSNIVAQRFGDRKQQKCWEFLAQKFKLSVTTCNNMQHCVKTVATCYIQRRWELLGNNVASFYTGPYSLFFFVFCTA